MTEVQEREISGSRLMSLNDRDLEALRLDVEDPEMEFPRGRIYMKRVLATIDELQAKLKQNNTDDERDMPLAMTGIQRPKLTREQLENYQRALAKTMKRILTYIDELPK